MKKIAIIGANEFQNPLILRAKELGFETHVFAWQADDIGERTADYFHPISITEKERILKECKQIGVDTVASVASDLAVLTVNHVARGLGLPCNDERTDHIATNKYLMREAFEASGVPAPRHMEADPSTDLSRLEGFTYPLIVKPTDRSGSRGICKIDRPRELAQAVRNACEQAFSGKAIIEEYIEGPEYSCECINWNGDHRVLAFTKKFTTGAPHFIETGHVQPSDIPPEKLPKMERAVLAALDALNIRWGASHAEFRINADGELRIIEIGARMGGDCIGSDLVPLSTGYDFLKMVIDVSMGQAPDFTLIREPERAEIRFAFTQAEAEELKTICQEHPERVWRMSEMKKESSGVTDSSTRLVFCIFHDKR